MDYPYWLCLSVVEILAILHRDHLRYPANDPKHDARTWSKSKKRAYTNRKHPA